MNEVFGCFTSLQICTAIRSSGYFSVKRGLGNLLNGQKRTGKLCQKIGVLSNSLSVALK